MSKMKIEVNVECEHITELARAMLKEKGLDPDTFDVSRSSSYRKGERGDGDVSYVKYFFEEK